MIKLKSQIIVLITAVVMYAVGFSSGVVSKFDTSPKLSKNDEYQKTINFNLEFIKHTSGKLLENINRGIKTTLIYTYLNEKDEIESFKKLSKVSGNLIINEIELTKKFFDPSSRTKIESLIKSLIPSKIKLDINNYYPIGKFSEFISAILNENFIETNLNEKINILKTFKDAGLINYSISNSEKANINILIYKNNNSKQTTMDFREFLLKFNIRKNKSIIANDVNYSDSNLMGIIRNDENFANKITTVDNFNEFIGKLTTLISIKSTLNNEFNNYGISEGAKALVPAIR